MVELRKERRRAKRSAKREARSTVVPSQDEAEADGAEVRV